MSATGGLGPLLWFFAVVALIPLVLWLFKRSPMGARMTGGPVRTVAMLPLSAQQKLVTVEIGEGDERRWLVLGVTPGSINLLTSMSPQEPAAPPAPPATPAEGFAQLLGRLRQGGGNPP